MKFVLVNGIKTYTGCFRIAFFVFLRVRETAKRTVGFVMSISPPAWNNSAPNERVFVKFYIWLFFENLCRKMKFY